MARDVPGTIYLLHLDRPFGHARHYLGWARDVEARLAAHAAGDGANLLRHVRAAGISWRLVRIWPGRTRADERRMHRYGHGAICPACTPPRRPGRITSGVLVAG